MILINRRSAGRQLQWFGPDLHLVEDLGLQLHLHNAQERVEQGEVVFQGALGFCVAMEPAARSSQVNVPVLTLHGEQRSLVRLKPAYLNPLNGLLEERELLADKGVRADDLDTLQLFSWSLQEGLAREAG